MGPAAGMGLEPVDFEQKKARYESGLKSISKEETWRRQVELYRPDSYSHTLFCA